MEEKKRTIAHSGPESWSKIDPTSDPKVSKTYGGVTSPITSLETTLSSGHAWPSAKGGTKDLGGNFSTVKIIGVDRSEPGFSSGSAFGYTYSGPQWAYNPYTGIERALSYVAFTSDASLNAKGSTAVARSIPTNPVADAGTFIGELKSGLPKLVGKELFKTKLKDYRKVGSEYLNVEFGWKPLVSDLQKFGKAAIESDKILKQLHRDSGKDVHRKFTFPDERYTTVDKYSNYAVWPGLGVSIYPYCLHNVGGDQLTRTVEVETKTWFSGSFTYHLNLGTTLPDRIDAQAAEARKLFGVELTPETVWNLAPWSWAVDWEGNIGDVLHNVSRFSQDGLVMRYGYIMQQKTAKVTYSLGWGGRLKDGPRKDLHLTIIAQSKIRRRASPFGFGFDMTALTGRQSAILGTLGISRGPRHS
jgi:hypothetical protein